MKISYSALLGGDQSISGSAVLPFSSVTKETDDLETLSGGAGVKALRTGPLVFNVAVASRDAQPIDVVLLKNGDPFRYLASGVSSVNTTVLDPSAKKGDQYAVQVGGSAIINYEPLFTSFSVVG